jgi:soluble lytic murein transglycosylase-like protein
MLVSYPVRLPLPARLLLFTAALTTAAHARERITLHNGFELECVHHETVDATHVRLYLPGENNYQDLPAAEIASVETIPDPPPTPAASPIPEPELDLHTLLARAGTQHNIDRELLASIVHAESAGNPRAVSRTGARGLMQLMPGTARELGVDDPNRPDQNIDGGTTYLDSLLTRYHDNLALALAAYNAGPAAVDRYHGIPPYRETRAYVLRVMTEFQRRSAAAHAKSATHDAALASR